MPEPLAPILNLIGYCRDFLREARSEAKGYLHLRRGASRGGYLDVATLDTKETLLFGEAGELLVYPARQAEVIAILDDIGSEFEDLESTDGNITEAEIRTTPDQEEEIPFNVLRRLYGLLQSNPHELECVYGILFLEGTIGAGQPVLAPLLTTPVSIRYDAEKDAIRVECEHAYARLNTYAISELMPDAYGAMEQELRELVERPLPLPLAYRSVQRALRTLRTLSGRVEVPQELLNDTAQLCGLERQGRVSSPLPHGHFRLRRYAALAVVRRGNVFVLDDLAEMAEMAKLNPQAFNGSLLARFALAEQGLGAEGGQQQNPLLGQGEILFPFPANPEQTEVAHAIEQHGLIRVQGPPGTGKSQTIANLVCHLAARGKRVLVASQQQKAVEVVQSYLDKLGIDFLPMTLLKGDREAMRTLKSRLDGLEAFMFHRTPEGLHRQGQAAEQKVAQLRQQMLDLEAELGRSLDFERTPWGTTGKKPGELAAEYAACRGYDQMAEGEAVAWEQQAEVVERLKQTVALRRTLGDRRPDLAELCKSTELPRDNEIESLLQDVRFIRDALVEEAQLCPRVEAAEVKQLSLFPHRPACTPEEVGKLKEALARQVRQLDELAGKRAVRATIEATADYDQGACGPDLESLQKFKEGLSRLRKLEEDSASCGDGGVQPEQLAEALEIYEAGRASSLSWLSPSFRKSQRIVATALGRKRLTRTTDIAPVRARVEAYRLHTTLSRRRTRQLSHLPIPEIPAHLDAAGERRLVALCSAVKEGLQVRDAVCQLSTELATALGCEVSSDLLLNHDRLNQVCNQLGRIQKVLEAQRAAQKAKVLVQKWNLSTRRGPLSLLADAVEAGGHARAQGIVSDLESYLPLVPKYRALCTLLTGPLAPQTAQAWIRKAEEEVTADFHQEIASQVRARALSTELTAANQAAPREPSVIAEESREVEKQYRKAAREAVKAYLHARIVKAYTQQETSGEVHNFSLILQQGRRNYEAFLNLKQRPAIFKAVLSVLPCWVATIQDVARVFPLCSRLFDIVIIDEASQCSIPSALPLFVRSQKAIVVGDDKQLPCVEGKFVRQTFNDELINRNHLGTLPRHDSFNACTRSLFDLAGSFREQSIFLAEHFRCHPHIITFSNKRFYAERLIILTHGRDQSLGAPTEMIPVKGATDDPQAKINRKEAEAVVRKLRVLINDPLYKGRNFGVCSPFRDQANFIWALILKEFTDKEIEARKLISATADGFQGDERDVILYSFRFAPNSDSRIFTLAGGPDGEKRMNVAFTRPKHRALCFISHSIESFPPGLVREFLRHAENPEAAILDGEPWDSRFEKDVHAFLESKGLQVKPQVKVWPEKPVDFILRSPTGRRIAALEADGWEIHYPNGRLREEDKRIQREMERIGWTVFRVHSRAFYRDPERALAHVVDYLAVDEALESESEVPISADTGEGPNTAQGDERRMQAVEATTGREPIDPTTIPLPQIQEALRSVAPEPGVEIQRHELYRRALLHVGLQRLTQRAQECFQSAMNGLIQRGEFGYRGQSVVWRLKKTRIRPTGPVHNTGEEALSESFYERPSMPTEEPRREWRCETCGKVFAVKPPRCDCCQGLVVHFR